SARSVGGALFLRVLRELRLELVGALLGRGKEVTAFGVARRTDRREAVQCPDDPEEAEGHAGCLVVFDHARDEILVDAIPYRYAFARYSLGVEANELADAGLVVANELLLPAPKLSIARAHHLHREVWRPVLPDLPRRKVAERDAQLHEDVGRAATPRV